MLRLEVGDGGGCEEDSHDRSGGGDAEEHGDGTDHPCAVKRSVVAAEEEPGASEGEQEEAVEEDGGGGFVDASDGAEGEWEGGESGDGGGEEKGEGDAAVGCGILADAAREPEGGERDADERGDDMEEGEAAVGGEGGVEGCELWSGCGAVREEECENPADDCGGCDEAECN